MQTIKYWLKDHELELTVHKTDLVLFTKWRELKTFEICIGAHVISSQQSLKYLGVTLDSKLSFKSHLKLTAQKPATVSSTLARMLPDVGGPEAQPTTGVGIGDKTGENRRQLQAAYRSRALRTCCPYRITSYEAACVIAGMIPVDILTDEASRLFENQEASLNKQSERPLAAWQTDWGQTENGRWTHRLTPDISMWPMRNHGETSYNLTQFLTRQGGYKKYLYRFGLDLDCPTCEGAAKNAE